MSIRKAACLVLCAVAGLVAGCGTGNPQAPANVSGSVSYNGKPVPGGVVKFVAPDGSQYSGDIGPDGTYSVADVPTGELIIVVDNSNLEAKQIASKDPNFERRSKIQGQQPPAGYGAGPTGAGADDRKFVKLPAKYANAKTSPLSLTVKAGRNVHSVEMTD